MEKKVTLMDNDLLRILFNKLHIEDEILPEQIPNLELYMDQVITLFESNLSHTKRNEEDKLLTKTMINNYTKDKLLMSAVKKKYSKEHIILMILIYNLKQSLAINDIKTVIKPIVTSIEEGNNHGLDEYYNKYLNVKRRNCKELLEASEHKLKEVKDIEGDNLLFLLSIIDMANGYKRLAERLIDEIFVE